MGFLDKLLGSTSEAQVKKLMPMVKRINELEGSMEALTDKELRAKTDEFRARLNNGETEDDLLPEAFAVVREAAKRTIGQRHYDVQLLGGIVLHQGRIAEMKTGEGKTITETLPGLSERPVRPRRAYSHRERLSGGARRPVDGQDI